MTDTGVQADLAAWLLAQIDEDRRLADEQDAMYAHTTLLPGIDSDHQANWEPDRVRLECDTKRRIIELHHQSGSLRDPREGTDYYDSKVYTCNECDAEWPFGQLPNGKWAYLDVWQDESGHPTLYPCQTLRLLAAVYKHRDGYREEWSPEEITR